MINIIYSNVLGTRHALSHTYKHKHEDIHSFPVSKVQNIKIITIIIKNITTNSDRDRAKEGEREKEYIFKPHARFETSL